MRAEGPDNNATADDDRCDCVLWRDHDRRCELWTVNGAGCLRLFDGETLLTEEPLVEGAVWAQALALRTWRPARRQRHEFGFRKRP
jgi:hypothetical protein